MSIQEKDVQLKDLMQAVPIKNKSIKHRVRLSEYLIVININ